MSYPCTRWAWSQKLPHTEKIVLLALADHANDLLECWPSMNTVADEVGMCRRNVLRIIAKLVEKNLISYQSRVTPYGKSSHIYTLNMSTKHHVTHSHIRDATHSHIEPSSRKVVSRICLVI